MTTPTVADLVAAIAEIKRVTPENGRWTHEDVWEIEYDAVDTDRAIATILNAVVSGALSPAATEPAEVSTPITMTYRNYRGEVDQRTVLPTRLWFGSTDWHPEPGWLMSAYDLAKAAHRDFALADCQFADLAPLSPVTAEAAAEALSGLMKAYKEIADSGDAGFWKAEEIPEYQAAAAALQRKEDTDQCSAVGKPATGVNTNGPSGEAKNAPVAEDEITRLTAERDAALARAGAAAVEMRVRAAGPIPQEFVAVGDGVTDDTAALQAKSIRAIPISPDTQAALDKLLREAEQRGQIKAGGVFADTDPEARYIEDMQNACPACGGSGHKDDAQSVLDKLIADARAGWQPIETAPKDGTMILVCLPRIMNLIVRARFDTVHKYWVTDYEGEGGIRVPHFFHQGDVWLPLPHPPEDAR